MTNIVRDINILTTKSEPFDFSSNEINPVELKNTLLDIMKKNNGVGLSAIQIGIPTHAFVVKEDYAFFNAKIVHSEGSVYFEEGCLSFPNLFVKIKRPETIRVRYQDEFGVTQTKLFTGILARVIQHELRHCEGKLFYNDANRYHLEKARKKLL